jgi:hypothetical protein
MSEKELRQITVQIKASVQTQCTIRSNDTDEYMLEYAKNSFIDSMEAKGIYIDKEAGDIQLTVLDPQNPPND